MKRLALLALLLTGKWVLASPGKVTTWHLVFGGDDAPDRVLITTDEEVQTLADGTRRMRVIEQFESHPQKVDFYVFTMDFSVAAKQMRTFQAYRIFQDGRLEFEEKPSAWMAVPNNWMRLCYEIVANPLHHQENQAVTPTLGKMVRPVDVVELNRRLLWEFKPSASQNS